MSMLSVLADRDLIRLSGALILVNAPEEIGGGGGGWVTTGTNVRRKRDENSAIVRRTCKWRKRC